MAAQVSVLIMVWVVDEGTFDSLASGTDEVQEEVAAEEESSACAILAIDLVVLDRQTGGAVPAEEEVSHHAVVLRALGVGEAGRSYETGWVVIGEAEAEYTVVVVP